MRQASKHNYLKNDNGDDADPVFVFPQLLAAVRNDNGISAIITGWMRDLLPGRTSKTYDNRFTAHNFPSSATAGSLRTGPSNEMVMCMPRDFVSRVTGL